VRRAIRRQEGEEGPGGRGCFSRERGGHRTRTVQLRLKGKSALTSECHGEGGGGETICQGIGRYRTLEVRGAGQRGDPGNGKTNQKYKQVRPVACEPNLRPERERRGVPETAEEEPVL